MDNLDATTAIFAGSLANNMMEGGVKTGSNDFIQFLSIIILSEILERKNCIDAQRIFQNRIGTLDQAL